MKEEIEKRRAEAAEKKKQMEEEESAKPAFAINPKGSSKVSVEGSCICAEPEQTIFLPNSLLSLSIPIMQTFTASKSNVKLPKGEAKTG